MAPRTHAFSARTPEQLGQILRGYRTQRGLTQAQLAAKIGIRQKTVSAIETDPASSSIDYLFRVLSGLSLELRLQERQRPTDTDW